MFYAEPTRGDSGQAGRLRGNSTLLGAEGYTQNQRAIEEPWVRCFRTRTSRLWADRVCPYRRRRLFALLRRPYTKIDISRQQSRTANQKTSNRAVEPVRAGGKFPRGRLMDRTISGLLDIHFSMSVIVFSHGGVNEQPFKLGALMARVT